MALSRTSHASAENSGSGTVTTASFTPPNNSLLFAVLCADPSSPSTSVAFSVSGGGLTWTRQLTLGPIYFGGSAPDYYQRMEVWTAPVTTGASMTVSGTDSASGANHQHLHVFSWTEYDTGSPIGATVTRNGTTDTGALSITLSASPASTSEVLAGRARIDSGSYDSTATPGSGWTELYDTAGSGGVSDLQTQVRGGSTSTTVAWSDVDDTAGTSAPWSVLSFGIEIKEAGGGGDTLFIGNNLRFM